MNVYETGGRGSIQKVKIMGTKSPSELFWTAKKLKTKKLKFFATPEGGNIYLNI